VKPLKIMEAQRASEKASRRVVGKRFSGIGVGAELVHAT
jgi:hypothetical protein